MQNDRLMNNDSVQVNDSAQTVNSSYDKIRIMVIDDQPNLIETDMDEYEPFFEIVHPDKGDNKIKAYGSVKDFQNCFLEYWEGDRRSSSFPVEIIATDFNLTQGATLPTNDQRVTQMNISFSKKVVNKDNTRKPISSSSNTINFDGYLIALLYSALTYQHPSIVVPITSYANILEEPCIKTLDQVFSPFIGSTKSEAIDSNQSRDIKNIISKALPALRDRIKSLFESEDIIIAIDDLVAMCNLHDVQNIPDNTRLRIYSPYGWRSLPVKGLFMNSEMSPDDWAKSMLARTMIQLEVVNCAKSLANIIWDTYQSEIIDNYVQLCTLHMNESRTKTESEDYNELCKKFGIKKNNRGTDTYRCTECICDITEDFKELDNIPKENHTQVRRLMVQLLIQKLLLHYIDAIQELDNRNGNRFLLKLDTYDYYCLLFPIPRHTFPSPFFLTNAKERSNGFTYFQTKINDLLAPKLPSSKEGTDSQQNEPREFCWDQFIRGKDRTFIEKLVLWNELVSYSEQVLWNELVSDSEQFNERGFPQNTALSKLQEAWNSFYPARAFFDCELNHSSKSDQV